MDKDFGQCRLCLHDRKLRKSHLMPAALWAGARDPGRKNPNPVLMTATVSRTSSNQLWTRLLCSACEERFNNNGERYVLSWIRPKGITVGEFPLLDRVKLALPIHSTSTLNAYAGDRVGIETEKFGYFALSIFWRAAVQRWRLPDGRLTQQIAIGELEDRIRKYLLSEADFPEDVVVLLTICLDEESRGTFYPPAVRRSAPVPSYGLLVQGVHFSIVIGANIPAEVRSVCCVKSPQHAIFLRDCREDTFRSFSTLASTSRPVSALRG
jgi:hypothetical protein